MALSFTDNNTQKTVTVKDVSDNLDDVKYQKIKELSTKCKETIIYGFTASNGHTYRLTIEDQLNMQGKKDEIKEDTTITDVPWLAYDMGKWINHTRDEWLTVFSEAFTHKETTLKKLDDKRINVNDPLTDTVAKVEAIVW